MASIYKLNKASAKGQPLSYSSCCAYLLRTYSVFSFNPDFSVGGGVVALY